MGITRAPAFPATWIFASSAAIATFMSLGLVAMQCSLVPRMASMRFEPPMAEHPLPGARLLQAHTVSRKYMQRVRCKRLPPVLAMLRSCADAPASRASESTGYCFWIKE